LAPRSSTGASVALWSRISSITLSTLVSSIVSISGLKLKFL
jgi:hypothetical protein